MEYKNVTIKPGQRNNDPGNNLQKNTGLNDGQTLYIGHHVQDENDSSIVMKPREGNKYHYRKTIGRGGMKVVLQVHDNDTMRDVAMALLPDISTRSNAELGQFLREARITASLEHPNIVPVHDIGVDSAGSPYFTMKLLTGETLASILKKLADGDEEYKKKYPLFTLLRVYTRICNAVAFAHSRGVLHMDLKPQNVQIGEYGEVLILDWGLARKIDIHDAKPSNRTTIMKPHAARNISAVLEDNDIKGTPGYMAPEQINKEQRFCSPQTDIYALGAILYAMLTYKNPLQSDNLQKMLEDTLTGNIMRPVERVKDREIPFGLEAVVLKAMSLDPQDRYQSVNELRTEIAHFMEGFATNAEKASFFKKSLLFVKRHQRSVFSGTLIVILSLLVGVALIREANRRVSVWLPVFSANFLKTGFPADAIGFCDFTTMKELEWSGRKSDDGLSWTKNEWLYIREPHIRDIKIACDIEVPLFQNGEIELLILSTKTGEHGHEPDKALYAYRIGITSNGNAEILEANNFFAPRIQTAASVDYSKIRKLQIEVIHQKDLLSISLNKTELSSVQHPSLPPEGMIFVALRSNINGFKLQNIDVFRLAPPENTTLLLAGDTLLQEGLYEKAIRSYIKINEAKPRSALAEQALLKAYLTASVNLPEPQRGAICLEIKKILAEQYPKFKLCPLLEADACNAWKNKDFAMVSSLLNQIFELNPASQIVSKILEMPHFPLNRDVARMLFKAIKRSYGLHSLNLSGFGLQSLQELQGLRLISLDCSNNKLSTLKDLKNLSIISLNCSNNRITDLWPIRNMPLRYLDCSNNKIKRFNALAGSSIERLRADGNPGKVPESILRKMKKLRYHKTVTGTGTVPSSVSR